MDIGQSQRDRAVRSPPHGEGRNLGQPPGAAEHDAGLLEEEAQNGIPPSWSLPPSHVLAKGALLSEVTNTSSDGIRRKRRPSLSPNTRNRTRGLRAVVYLLRLCLRTPLVPGSLRRGLSDQRPAFPKGNHSLWSTGRRCRGAGNPMEKVKGHLWYLSEDRWYPISLVLPYSPRRCPRTY